MEKRMNPQREHEGFNDDTSNSSTNSSNASQSDEQNLVLIPDNVVTTALHVLCQSQSDLNYAFPSIDETQFSWQDENEHPLLRWEVVLRIEQMLIEKLLPCHHNRLENEVIILARILENYMYFVAPSLEHYNNLSTLSFVTKLFVVYIATRYCQQEDVDVRTLHRLYCSVIRGT